MNKVIPMNYDFTRTRAALAEYDKYSNWMDTTTAWQCTSERCIKTFAKLEELGKAVGRAYGEDTSSVNSPDTTEGCVRPNPWLRKMVAL